MYDMQCLQLLPRMTLPYFCYSTWLWPFLGSLSSFFPQLHSTEVSWVWELLLSSLIIAERCKLGVFKLSSMITSMLAIIEFFLIYSFLHKCVIFSRALDLSFKRINQVYQVKSSTTTKMYFIPLRLWTLAGPIRSMCSNSNGLDVWTSLMDRCLDFTCLPIWHDPHILFSIFLNFGKRRTASHLEIFSICLWLACPNCRCHKSTLFIFTL